MEDEKDLIARVASMPVVKYELNLKKGIAKASDAEDHKRLVEAIQLLKEASNAQAIQTPVIPVSITQPDSAGPSVSTIEQANPNLTSPTPATPATPTRPPVSLMQMMDNFQNMKKMAPRTIKGYKETLAEFNAFLGNPKGINQITQNDVIRFRQHLINKPNKACTVDKKVMSIRSVLRFAVEEQELTENPAVVRNLLTSYQKENDGYEIFDEEEVRLLFQSQYFKQQLTNDPHYYWCVLLTLLTGLRHSEVVGLTRGQIKQTDVGNHYVHIRKGKTAAAIRCIPVPAIFFDHGFQTFISGIKRDQKIFRFTESNGGLGTAFADHRTAVGITREKLVLHSLRKFYNDQLRNDGVSLEVRAPLLGHRLAHVNIAKYSRPFTLDDLTTKSAATLKRLVKMTVIAKGRKPVSTTKTVGARVLLSQEKNVSKASVSKASVSKASVSKASVSKPNASKANASKANTSKASKI